LASFEKLVLQLRQRKQDVSKLRLKAEKLAKRIGYSITTGVNYGLRKKKRSS